MRNPLPPLRAAVAEAARRVQPLRTVVDSGLLAPMRPDKYVQMAAVFRRGVSATIGISLASVRSPQGTAIIDERGTITWRDLDDSCDALAAAFQNLTRGAPATIGVLCRNHRGIVQAMAAAGRIGSDVVLLNTGHAGPQLADIVGRENVDVLVHDEEFESAVESVESLDDPPTRVLAWTDSETSQPTIDGLVASHAGQTPRWPARAGRIVLLTSGTSGSPRGARRPSGGSANDLLAVLGTIPWRAEEPVVVAAPIFHAWGFSQVLLASAMACPIVTCRRFDAENTLRLVEKHRATGLVVVPVMLERMVDLPEEVRRGVDAGSLRFATASGSRMRTDAVTAFMDEVGDVLYSSYNATEAGMVSIATPADLRAAPDTAGRPVQGTHVRILDDEGTPVPDGEVGQIFVRNRSMFEGYTSGPGKAMRDGYMATGDLGWIDDAGRLYVVGRDDEMVISGGENIYPIEVEHVLVSHPDVLEAAVVGVRDEAFGERLAAFVVPEPGASVSEAELKEHVRDRLAAYKVPREIVMVDELPRNAAGKVVKRLLPSVGDRAGDRDG